MSPPEAEHSLVRLLLRATQTALRLRRIESASQAVHDEADSALELAFVAIWNCLSSIELGIAAEAIRLGKIVVLASDDDDEGLISSLAGAGVQSLTLLPGVELEEIKLVLTAVSAARERPSNDGTDLLTFLFRADLNYVHYELAVVHAANSDASFMHRPIARLLCGRNGLWLSPAPLVDLAETDEAGNFSRSIIKVTSADKYGIKVSDYFV
jgi:hypothetical protein